MNLKTIEFIKENKNWKEILTNKPYSMTIKEDDYFYLLKYNQIESDFSLDIVKECRGLIIDKNTLEPVALSFKKFFNYSEPNASEIDWNNCRVLEKVDGSKLLIWYNKYMNTWIVSTSGCLNAYETPVNDLGITFGSLFEDALTTENISKQSFFDMLDKNYCYTFELVSPLSQIVVSYPETRLYFIGKRNVNTFEEEFFDNDELTKIFKTSKQFDLHSLIECVDMTSNMGFNEEGFVVVDNKFNRVKIKSLQYLKAYYLKASSQNQSMKGLLSIIEENEEDEFLSYFPQYTTYINDLKEKKDKLLDEIKTACIWLSKWFYTKEMSRKEFALYIMNNYKDISSFLFTFLTELNIFDAQNSIISLEEFINDFVRKEWDKLLINKKVEYLKNFKNI